MTTPVHAIEFPLIAARLVDFLGNGDPQAQLAAIPDTNGDSPIPCAVASEVPNPRPQRLVVVYTMPTAGPQSLVLSTRRLAFQIYENSEFTTALVTEKVRALVYQSRYEGLGIKSVRTIGEPARFPAPGVPYRWQFTADVMVRAIPGPWGN